MDDDRILEPSRLTTDNPDVPPSKEHPGTLSIEIRVTAHGDPADADQLAEGVLRATKRLLPRAPLG